MSYNGPDRRSKSTERRKTGQGKPPPGTVIDRRLGLDPRKVEDLRSTKNADTLASEAELSQQGSESSRNSSPTEEGFTGLERKRGRGRRLSDFTKSAEEGEMTTEQFLFLMAIDAFKKGNDRMFPTWTDVLEVIRLLGYRKTMPTELNLPSAEDWLERSDSPANVRPDRWAERFTESDSGLQKKKAGPKSDEELTDEALEAFEAAFGSDDEVLEADEFMGEDFDSDIDSDGLNEAA
ncbi:MAG: hypothetical protein P1U42_07035 [Phycisphaerales bacterium]|nr:hypothetical protein [Phycisphaerales bacterium]